MKIYMVIIYIILSVLLLFGLCILGSRLINKINYSITSNDGIESYGFIELGGIQQYVQIRGNSKKNPVIVFVHGGPGFPITYLSTFHQQYLESSYTIVNYDQRGSGRTYYKNIADKNSIYELNHEILEQDLDELVDYICKLLKKEKVIIMGQSWGTVLGINYVNKKPKKVEAYIGVGQVIDFDEGKVYSGKKALRFANAEDALTLQNNIVNFKNTNSIGEIDIENLESLIVTSGKYLASGNELSGLQQAWIGLTSPKMNLNDLKWLCTAINTKKIFTLEEPLINYMYYEYNIYDLKSNWELPMYFIQGTNDYITPTDMVQEYFEEINCVDKKLVLQNEGGHTPFLDDPRSFADIIIELLQ